MALLRVGDVRLSFITTITTRKRNALIRHNVMLSSKATSLQLMLMVLPTLTQESHMLQFATLLCYRHVCIPPFLPPPLAMGSDMLDFETSP
jgi:hypothetical protein